MFGGIAGLGVSAVVLLVGSSVASRFILVFFAFASFYVAENVLHILGILAVMMTAIVTRFMLREVEAFVAEGFAGTWEWLGVYFNSILFAIMRLVIALAMFRDQWLAMLVAIGAAIVARVIATGASCLLARPISTPISLAWQGLLVWGAQSPLRWCCRFPQVCPIGGQFCQWSLGWCCLAYSYKKRPTRT